MWLFSAPWLQKAQLLHYWKVRDMTGQMSDGIGEILAALAKVPAAQRYQILATTLVPVIDTFRDELGRERIDPVVRQGLLAVSDGELGQLCIEGIIDGAADAADADTSVMKAAGSGMMSIAEQTILTSTVLVPVLKALQDSLGVMRANEVARKALREWSLHHGNDIGAMFTGTDVEKMTMAFPLFTEGACDYQVVEQTEESFHLNVHRCKYAEYFKGIDEPELGGMIWCGADFPMADGIGDGVRLERTHTIMKGDDHCNFRYNNPNSRSED